MLGTGIVSCFYSSQWRNCCGSKTGSVVNRVECFCIVELALNVININQVKKNNSTVTNVRQC